MSLLELLKPEVLNHSPTILGSLP